MANASRHLYLSFQSFFGRADVMRPALFSFLLVRSSVKEKGRWCVA
jgi:hypothetical protein